MHADGPPDISAPPRIAFRLAAAEVKNREGPWPGFKPRVLPKATPGTVLTRTNISAAASHDRPLAEKRIMNKPTGQRPDGHAGVGLVADGEPARTSGVAFGPSAVPANDKNAIPRLKAVAKRLARLH